MHKPRVFIALGSNTPFERAAPAEMLARGVAAMQVKGLMVRALSGIWQTAAWPPSDQPDYYNAVVELEAAGLKPQPLYEKLREIEARFGRERRERWQARTLDLDIVAMDGFVGVFGDITLPHARMHERAFVLAPLVEIAPDWRHPILGLTPVGMLEPLLAGQRAKRVSALAPAEE